MAENGPTEAILERARDLDQRSVDEILRLIHEEDALAHAAVGRVLDDIARAIDVLVLVVGGGGRWFNVGAGTSGRMGVLDASEIPPTFGLHQKIVQGVIAGGDRALREAVEGAEDNQEAGAWELRERGLRMGDAVVAISASGRTPYVLGALEVAHEVGARSIAITCDGGSPLAEAAEITIAPEVGPEVVAGSTRMKGGLAQKMVLHLLSTAVMVKLGRVEGNLMTKLSLSNEKLRSRALQIVMTLSGADSERARALLEAHDGCVESAVRAARAPDPPSE
ncbi:MAG: N-acetylmuramic acid 6-phosphate etherase [Deltaproteobacteria bacterium]|nr:N-acetylmuramic acid 6-phosphate etherase [Deltaproteobacteria bacterium]MBW2418913.1 N-acetylmuramic acid 6-phosphate etherase [Deltaproteobacteria bacterium]